MVQKIISPIKNKGRAMRLANEVAAWVKLAKKMENTSEEEKRKLRIRALTLIDRLESEPYFKDKKKLLLQAGLLRKALVKENRNKNNGNA